MGSFEGGRGRVVAGPPSAIPQQAGVDSGGRHQKEAAPAGRVAGAARPGRRASQSVFIQFSFSFIQFSFSSITI